MKTLLSGVADDVTKDQPAVHDMLGRSAPSPRNIDPLGQLGRSS